MATSKSLRRQHGFSLIELMVSVAILTVVIGVVVQGVNTMQIRNTVEVNRVDLTQESREFMDQITNDMHQSGFPRIGMFDPATLANAANCGVDPNVACGLVNISQNSIQFEGDVDGTGVSEEWIQLVQTNGPGALPCTAPPCVIQRGTVLKASWLLTGTAPPYYAEVNNVMNTNIFTASDNMGNQIVPPAIAGNNAWQFNIKSIGITLYVRSSQVDPQTGVFPTVTMVSTVEIKD
jgi:prepilin-type N-terminal cleavage/methylation domain-containing protein